MEKYKSSLLDRIELADKLICYFQGLLSSHHSFRLGLYMAKQWRKYLVEDQHDLDELRVFLDALEDNALLSGTSWYELAFHVQLWLAELEETAKSPNNERVPETS